MKTIKVGARGYIGVRVYKEQCSRFGVKQWIDYKMRDFGELVGWVRYLSQYYREFIPKRRDNCGSVTIGQTIVMRGRKGGAVLK